MEIEMSTSSKTIDRIARRFMAGMTIEFKKDGTVELQCLFAGGIGGKNFPDFGAMVDGLADMLASQEKIANEKKS
jgi:hypothetical protein